MNIALIGYGKMGKIIEDIALKRNHTIVSIIDKNNQADFQSEAFRSANVAIEFSQPEFAIENMLTCFQLGVPVVCGTTGWHNKLDEVTNLCKQYNGSLFYASNFSIGVNILFHLNKILAGVMNKTDGYDAEILEIHHIHKLDAPSGTAITLAEGLMKNFTHKTEWVNNIQPQNPNQLQIISQREGEVPGYHKVTYKSDIDTIEIIHNANGRIGFATGAVVAAEFLHGKKGVFNMENLLTL